MILWLDDVSAQNRFRVGGKGSSLARCRGLGLPVPDGFCVTVDAFTAAISQIRDRERGPCGKEPFPFPSGLEDALAAAYDRLGKPAVAVRSSGVDEDSESHSLAGQHETLLGVRGESALFDAVRACWASVWSDSAIEYRRRQGITGVSPIAVVVQPMVAPDVSGVLFTRDPVSGAPGKVVINASYGLGESVVSGLIVPDAFVVSVNPPRVVSRVLGSKKTRMDVGEQGVIQTRVPSSERSRLCLDDDQLLRLVDIGMRLERHYGSAQDVEWALCDGEVVLLQSRPITAQADSVEPVKSIEPSIERPLSARSRAESFIRADLAEHLPGPMPLDLAAVHRLIKAIGQVLDRAGINPPDPEALIQSHSDGTIRLNVSVPPQHPLRLLRMPVVAVRGLRHDPRRWPQEEAAVRRRMNRLAKLIDRRAEIDSAALMHLLDAVLDAAAHVLYDRYRNYLIPMALTRSLTRRLAAVADPRAGILEEDLYRGLPYVTAKANEGVSHLVDQLRRLGLVKALLELGPRRFLHDIDTMLGGDQFHADLNRFLTDFGARAGAPYLAFSSRSWRERPEDLLGMISAQLRGADAPQGRRADVGEVSGTATVRSIAMRLPAVLRRSWYRSVSRQRAMHVGREGTLYLIEELFFQARRIVDEISNRLVARGVLEAAEDILLLYEDEMRRALILPPDGDLLDLVEQRRRDRGRAQEAWRRSCAAEPNAIEADARLGDELVLRGLPSAAGQATGRARVILSPQDFANLGPGEILVCPFTDPSWTPLFSLAAGVVSEAGGPLSHAAIVAREYGIPAVLGVGDATVQIRDGDLIVVDGSAGVVTAVRANSEPLQ